jgi:hypothetical protein
MVGPLGILERAIPDHLGIKPAIAGAVDFLEENAIERWADPGSRPIRLDDEAG